MGVMGCVQAKSGDERQAEEKSKKIDKQIKEERDRSNKKVKLLLLGPAESGKSTVAKQLRILHQDGFTEDDRIHYKDLVYFNVFSAMQAMIEAMDVLDLKYENEDRLSDAKQVLDVCQNVDLCDIRLDDEIVEAIERLWNDSGFQHCYDRSREYQLSDSAKYFLDKVKELAQPDYLPSDEDVLRTRVRSTGIVETTFQYKGLDFTLIDVAGHRSERRKWIHCFEDVTAIVYCVAMSEYDQVLIEDNETNRMEESLKLFDSICNNPYFVNTAFILFLNKKDLFQQKVKKSPISTYFPDYKGKNSYDEASSFIRKMFESVNKEKRRDIFTHFTCATDTENIRFVFNCVHDVISGKIINAIFGPN